MQSVVHIKLSLVLIRIICLVLSGLLLGLPGISQDSLMNYREAVYLQTDRDLYVVGEQVWMKVYKMDALDRTPDNFSQVVYMELINQAGYPVNQVKLYLPQESGSAAFILSDTLSSGNYLLRAYTNWMKNYSARDFSYRTISVINPFRSLSGIGIGSSTPDPEELDILNTPKSSKGLHLEISMDQKICGPREQIVAHVQAKDSSGEPVEADLSVSVVRSCLIKDSRKNISEGSRISDNGPAMPASFLPELEGLILDGTLRNNLTEKPISNKNLMLSILGKTARCQLYLTNENGGFYFNLDGSGIHEVVIQPEDSSVNDYYIDLNSDFLNTYEHPLPGPFYLDTTKLRVLNQSIISMQVEKAYRSFRQQIHEYVPEEQEINFYGEPDYRIRISDYILLQNIREVIKEIVPSVSVRVKNGKSHFRLENGVDNLHFENQPLVLVDGVPFDDVDQILNIPIRDLEYIEVINFKYLLDGYMFEGLIHFITNEGKMAGLEFKHNVFRQAYAGLGKKYGFKSPDYKTDSLMISSLPDFRNTLYWNPTLYARKDGRAVFEFYSSDESGEYSIYVEGISPEGESGFLFEKLLVQ